MTRATVMIVDDEAPLLRAMQRVLGKTFEVIPASGVTSAVEAFSPSVQVVLTDFSMPDGNGLAVARAVRAKGFKGPIAVLSAVVECDELQAALKAGEVSELISKPWKSSELVDQVRALCDRPVPVDTDPAGSRRPAA
jgi:DNA-binding NtrC family response regulator